MGKPRQINVTGHGLVTLHDGDEAEEPAAVELAELEAWAHMAASDLALAAVALPGCRWTLADGREVDGEDAQRLLTALHARFPELGA